MHNRCDFPSQFRLGDQRVGEGRPCFIIAEAGLSHMGDMSNIDPLIEVAVKSGCNAFKTQHFHTPELINQRYAPDWYERYRSKALKDEDIILISEKCKRLVSSLCAHHMTSIH